MFSGVADNLTRDVRPHGYLNGHNIQSSTFMIGHFKDWREGMEKYADNNAIIAPQREWNKAMPIGWNSWGALAFNVNHDNSTEVVKFFAKDLQPHSLSTKTAYSIQDWILAGTVLATLSSKTLQTNV